MVSGSEFSRSSLSHSGSFSVTSMACSTCFAVSSFGIREAQTRRNVDGSFSATHLSASAPLSFHVRCKSFQKLVCNLCFEPFGLPAGLPDCPLNPSHLITTCCFSCTSLLGKNIANTSSAPVVRSFGGTPACQSCQNGRIGRRFSWFR